MIDPLGMDEKLWKKRNERVKKEYAKHKSWKHGYEAGRKGVVASENPYTLSPDIWKLLKRRTLWELGRQEAVLTPTRKKLKMEAKAERENRRHEHKHKHHSKHRHHKQR